MKPLMVLVLASAGVVGCDGTSRFPGPPGPGGSTAECVESSDTCSGENICIDGSCESSFPRIYTATIDLITFPMRVPGSGECWDTPCGPPDPFVIVTVNGSQVARTSLVDDMFSASWTERFDLQLIAGSRIEVKVMDQDAVADDLALNCIADPITADQLRSRGIGCNQDDPGNTRVSALVLLEPK